MNKLPENLRTQLEQLPEHGMGYQLVDVVMTDGRRYPNQVVFNCEQLQNADIPIRDIKRFHPSDSPGP